jgi:hypothetical protein
VDAGCAPQFRPQVARNWPDGRRGDPHRVPFPLCRRSDAEGVAVSCVGMNIKKIAHSSLVPSDIGSNYTAFRAMIT